mmetsp:Transcript_44565/g.93524  ORF Transcript_44565/g.93524 Transcript_44565/m.93524 type:complete len:132 (-) Transcript_44565:145-540(-)
MPLQNRGKGKLEKVGTFGCFRVQVIVSPSHFCFIFNSLGAHILFVLTYSKKKDTVALTSDTQCMQAILIQVKVSCDFKNCSCGRQACCVLSPKENKLSCILLSGTKMIAMLSHGMDTKSLGIVFFERIYSI